MTKLIPVSWKQPVKKLRDFGFPLLDGAFTISAASVMTSAPGTSGSHVGGGGRCGEGGGMSIRMYLEEDNEKIVSEIAGIQEISFHTVAVEV